MERETYQLNRKGLAKSFKNLTRITALASVLNFSGLPGSETQVLQKIPTQMPNAIIMSRDETTNTEVLPKIIINLPTRDLKSADDVIPKTIVFGEPFNPSTQILPPDVLEQLNKPKPETTPLQKTYSKNLYDNSSVLYQNPDFTACVPASTEMMLNFIAKKGTPGNTFVWSPDSTYNKMEKIFTFEKANDTLAPGSLGSDPNGWRNGLNEFGWNNFQNPNEMVYKVKPYIHLREAVKAIVKAIALYDKPVGILGWGGSHAQIINGYEVSNADPKTSDNYKIEKLYLTDPLQGDGMRNAEISNAQFSNGSNVYRFQPYSWTDSPYDDPYTPGNIEAYKEWYGKFVIIEPVK